MLFPGTPFQAPEQDGVPDEQDDAWEELEEEEVDVSDIAEEASESIEALLCNSAHHVQMRQELQGAPDLDLQGSPQVSQLAPPRMEAPAHESGSTDGIRFRPGKTAKGLLEQAEMLDYHPPPDDGPSKMLSRAVALRPFVTDFSTKIRVSEGALSRAQLTNQTSGLNSHNKRLHEVAQARRALGSNTARQSRASLWCQFQNALHRRKEPCENTKLPIQPVKTFIPGGLQTGEVRVWQVLVVRTHRSEKPKLALTMAVFRGALFRKKTAKRQAFVSKCRGRTWYQAISMALLKSAHSRAFARVAFVRLCLSFVICFRFEGWQLIPYKFICKLKPLPGWPQKAAIS